jgi:hypothetical protein
MNQRSGGCSRAAHPPRHFDRREKSLFAFFLSSIFQFLVSLLLVLRHTIQKTFPTRLNSLCVV